MDILSDVQPIPPIIDKIIEELTELLKINIDVILRPCSGNSRIPLWKRSAKAEILKQMAPEKLYSYLQHKYLKAASARPSVMTTKVFQAFVNRNPGNILPTNIPQYVLANTARKDSEQLLRNAGISKLYNTNSIIARMRTPFNETMSVDNIRNAVFLSFVKKLIKKNELVGRDNTTLRVIESKILNGSLTDREMYMLIREHIMSEYMKQADSITNSHQLLEFIGKELEILSALVSDFYPSYLGMIDLAVYNTYSHLLTKYIELILQEHPFSLVDDSTKIAQSIVTIVSERICLFFELVGDPDPATRPTIKDEIILHILTAAKQFLSTRFVQSVPVVGADGGGNRRRIKKYKNRSNHRSSRRTSRVTRYRTNRYKIKNKKTRKTRK